MPHIDLSDPISAGDAQAVVAVISARYRGLIAEISENQGMSETQKEAAIAGLRFQQERESANAVQAITAQARAGESPPPRPKRQEQSQTHVDGDGAAPARNSGSSDSKDSAPPGVLRAQFRAAFKDATRRAEDPKPKPRRRRGETDKGFVPARRKILDSGATARGRYAGLRQVVSPTGSYAIAGMYLSETLDWLNLWEDNAGDDYWHEDAFSAKQEYSYQL